MIIIRFLKSRRRWIYTSVDGVVMHHIVFDNGTQTRQFVSQEFSTMSDVRASLRGDKEIIHDDGEP